MSKFFKKLSNPLHLNVKKVLTVAAGAAAIYFTGGAALPLILKAKMAKMRAAQSGESADYSGLLNEAWEGVQSNNPGLGGLVSRVQDNPILGALRGGMRGMYMPRRSQPVYDEEEEDVGPGDEEDDGGDDGEED